jgi:hypothetical protein
MIIVWIPLAEALPDRIIEWRKGSLPSLLNRRYKFESTIQTGAVILPFLGYLEVLG